jgi:hypothetical protein
MINIFQDDYSHHFKYASIKYRANKDINNSNLPEELDIPFITGALIISKKFILILNYNPQRRKFESIYNFSMKNLLKLTINFIIYDDNLNKGIEIISESYGSLLPLIDELFQNIRNG